MSEPREIAEQIVKQFGYHSDTELSLADIQWLGKEIKQALIAYGDERARKEKEKLSQWMLSMNLSTGHGDTMEDLFKELEWWIDRIMTR